MQNRNRHIADMYVYAFSSASAASTCTGCHASHKSHPWIAFQTPNFAEVEYKRQWSKLRYRLATEAPQAAFLLSPWRVLPRQTGSPLQCACTQTERRNPPGGGFSLAPLLRQRRSPCVHLSLIQCCLDGARADEAEPSLSEVGSAVPCKLTD